jgi:hypothetical protein
LFGLLNIILNQSEVKIEQIKQPRTLNIKEIELSLNFEMKEQYGLYLDQSLLSRMAKSSLFLIAKHSHFLDSKAFSLFG